MKGDPSRGACGAATFFSCTTPPGVFQFPPVFDGTTRREWLYRKGYGGMAEWLKAAVLKTAEARASVGSNPTPSATMRQDRRGGRVGCREPPAKRLYGQDSHE